MDSAKIDHKQATKSDIIDQIRRHEAFAGIEDAVLVRLIDSSRIVCFAQGETLVAQGEDSDCAFVLLEGTIAVLAKTDFGFVTLSTLTGVQILGDVGVYAQLSRSATLLAHTPVRALRLEQDAMLRLSYEAPDVILHMIRQLGARLNAFNQAIATYADALDALSAEQGDPILVEALLNPPPELTNFAAAFRKMAAFIAEQRRRRDEMASATAIQTALLPLPLPIDPGGRFQLDARIRPARHVGGDFFDALVVDADHLVVTMGDVSGKGIPAALFATVCQMVMRLVLDGTTDLGACLARANTLIDSANRESMFATFFVARLDLRTGALRYCNAGHVEPLIQRVDGAIEALKGEGLPLAVLDDADYRESGTVLNPGDRLLLCTDGVTEAVDAEGREFGLERLVATLAPLSRQDPDPAAAIVAAVDAFCEGAEQFDDIACLILSRPC